MESSTLLLIFEYVAMCPLSMGYKFADHRAAGAKHKIRNRILVLWSVVIVACLTTVYIVVVSLYHMNILRPRSNFISLNDLAKLSAIYLTHFIIIIEALWTRNQMSLYLTKLIQVNADLVDLFVEPKKRHVPPIDIYLRKFISYLVFACTIETIIIVRVQSDPPWSVYWWICIVPLMMGRMRHLQHALFVDILTIRFTLIRKEIEYLIKLSANKKANGIDDEYLISKLRIVKCIYSNLYEMSNHLSASFGLSQLVNLMQNFIQLTSDLFSIYAVLYRNDFTNLIGEQYCF